MKKTMETENKLKKKNIWNKLMDIQRSMLTFGVSELSDKIDPNTGKPAYTYTPGWQVVETIRKKMDEASLMLIPNFRLKECPVIDYPVYKMVGSEVHSFTKKEVHFVVEADFTWIDTESGEQAGPFYIVASGANGTDKSSASALALAERYFFLKFFHITTHDKTDEPDAHDSDNISGLEKLAPASTRGAASGAKGRQGTAAQTAPVQPVATAPYPQPAQPVAPAAPAGRQNGYAAPPAYGPVKAVPQSGQLDFNNPAVVNAVTRLAQFDQKTSSHGETLNKVVGELCGMGFQMNQNLVDQLVAAGQNLRTTGQLTV